MKKRNVMILMLTMLLLLNGCSKRAKETDVITTGIDVARYQGTIDWNRLAHPMWILL